MMKPPSRALRLLVATIGVAGTIAACSLLYLNLGFILYSVAPPTRAWSQYGQSDVAQHFIDTNSPNRIGDIVEYTILLNYKASATPTRSAQITAAIDCRKRVRKIVLLGPNFSDQMATGAIVGTSGPPSGALESVKHFQPYAGNSQITQEETILCD